MKSTLPVEFLSTKLLPPDLIAAHFVHTELLCAKYNMRDPWEVLNTDENVVSFS